MEPLGNRRGMGLGFEGRDRDQRGDRMRDQVIALQPPTREEIARTIFVGNITEGCGGDEGMQRLLGVAGGLRRWNRSLDADGKPCTFGFAEYEDADSLRTASEVFKEVEVPKEKPTMNGVKKSGNTTVNGVKEEEGDEEAEKEEEQNMTQLLVVIDENSQKYIEEWSNRGSLADPSQAQFRFDSAREELSSVLAGLSRAGMVDGLPNGTVDHEGDTAMQDTQTKVDAVTGEVVTIPLNAEDELSDIPAEMRETVAKEITAFRDRSTKRDLERLRREEELEAAEKQRAAGASRINRLASPPPNGVGVRGAPLGPKGFQGAQIPNDYRKGVSFVNGNGVHTQEEEDSDASDDEIERRRKAKRDADLEKLYLDQERRWLNREKSRTAAVEREKQRDRDEEANEEKEKAAVAKRLKEWDDDIEASRRVEEYYHDRTQWLRNRSVFRSRELEADNRDRAAEDREKSRDQERINRDLGMADQFLAQQAEELDTTMSAPEPARFKMSLGAAAQKAQAAAAPRRTVAEVEGLLEDEEDEEATTMKRTLRPIAIEDIRGGAQMTEEERADAARQLAKEIPNEKEGLWSWPIKWDFVDDAIITEQLRPFVERKVVEYLGVQEQLLVDVVEETIKKKGSPQALVSELEGVSRLPRSPLC